MRFPVPLLDPRPVAARVDAAVFCSLEVASNSWRVQWMSGTQHCANQSQNTNAMHVGTYMYTHTHRQASMYIWFVVW